MTNKAGRLFKSNDLGSGMLQRRAAAPKQVLIIPCCPSLLVVSDGEPVAALSKAAISL